EVFREGHPRLEVPVLDRSLTATRQGQSEPQLALHADAVQVRPQPIWDPIEHGLCWLRWDLDHERERPGVRWRRAVVALAPLLLRFFFGLCRWLWLHGAERPNPHPLETQTRVDGGVA